MKETTLKILEELVEMKLDFCLETSMDGKAKVITIGDLDTKITVRKNRILFKGVFLGRSDGLNNVEGLYFTMKQLEKEIEEHYKADSF